MKKYLLDILKSSTSPLLYGYRPRYGGPLRLDSLLYATGNPPLISSKYLGREGDRLLTLEEFLLEIPIPQIIEKDVTLTLRGETFYIGATLLYSERDILYINVSADKSSCLRRGSLSLGREDIPVVDIESLEVYGKVWLN